MSAHIFPLKVYYEDTDMAGIVYYANYLRYIERARSEIAEQLGLDQRAMRAAGIVFAVSRVEADYLSPARFGDVLQVETVHYAQGKLRWVFEQSVTREGRALFRAKVTVISMNTEGRPQRLPAKLRLEPR
ncbi:MAG: YbgC/FadM family acyl-CoA thioesterase [Sulfitobacter sp.]